ACCTPPLSYSQQFFPYVTAWQLRRSSKIFVESDTPIPNDPKYDGVATGVLAPSYSSLCSESRPRRSARTHYPLTPPSSLRTVATLAESPTIRRTYEIVRVRLYFFLYRRVFRSRDRRRSSQDPTQEHPRFRCARHQHDRVPVHCVRLSVPFQRAPRSRQL